MNLITAVITGLLTAGFLATGGMKLAGLPQSLEVRDHLGIPASSWLAIGALEVAGAVGAAVGLAVRPLGLAATGGLVLLAIGAVATHVRAKDPASEAAPAGVALLLAAAALALQMATA
ncbi:MAG: hypothetical protein QOG62_1330 [Thermoleophilaceae bacterium]|nr:hypothetical protein [Thermoleophilaceae bacterium]